MSFWVFGYIRGEIDPETCKLGNLKLIEVDRNWLELIEIDWNCLEMIETAWNVLNFVIKLNIIRFLLITVYAVNIVGIIAGNIKKTG